MDKNAIKKFAVWARRELIARVSQKAEQYGITEEHHGDAYADRIGEQLLTRTEQNQRKNLIIRIEQEGYKQVMEEVAYTWFKHYKTVTEMGMSQTRNWRQMRKALRIMNSWLTTMNRAALARFI